jgi:hypothetical protein
MCFIARNRRIYFNRTACCASGDKILLVFSQCYVTFNVKVPSIMMMSSTIPSNAPSLPGVPPASSPSKAQGGAPIGEDEAAFNPSPVGGDTFSTDSSDGPTADSSIPVGGPKSGKPQPQPAPGQDASVSGASFDTVA